MSGELSYSDFSHLYPDTALKFLKWAAENGFAMHDAINFKFRPYSDAVAYATPPSGKNVAEYQDGQWEYAGD